MSRLHLNRRAGLTPWPGASAALAHHRSLIDPGTDTPLFDTSTAGPKVDDGHLIITRDVIRRRSFIGSYYLDDEDRMDGGDDDLVTVLRWTAEGATGTVGLDLWLGDPNADAVRDDIDLGPTGGVYATTSIAWNEPLSKADWIHRSNLRALNRPTSRPWAGYHPERVELEPAFRFIDAGDAAMIHHIVNLYSDTIRRARAAAPSTISANHLAVLVDVIRRGLHEGLRP